MWQGKTVSVIFPTYNEKDSIRESIEDFFDNGFVDEIIVVNNNAALGTSEEVAKTKAKEVLETVQGYGAAIQRGFKEAKGDLLIVSEPDNTFSGHDVIKLLAYSKDFEFILGTRTAEEFIWEGANMGFFLRWGNYAVAKLMEILFDSVALSDVGCTMRLITRSALEKMQPYFAIKDNYFGPEMMLLACILKIPFIQIPVNYKKRIGKSSVTGNKIKAFKLGLQMINLIFKYRCRSLFGKFKK
ncbi:MAG: glycosyltransferase family 2 protein [Armatimonadetes bacterium]|nr:glycosyltransferase family 2 protein [Armatimonadota bacterium]